MELRQKIFGQDLKSLSDSIALKTSYLIHCYSHLCINVISCIINVISCVIVDEVQKAPKSLFFLLLTLYCKSYKCKTGKLLVQT